MNARQLTYLSKASEMGTKLIIGLNSDHQEQLLNSDKKTLHTQFERALVLASLIVGAASLTDLKHVAKIGGKTLGFYALTAVMAITIGLLAANFIQPGHIMDQSAKDRLLDTYQDDAKSKI